VLTKNRFKLIYVQLKSRFFQSVTVATSPLMFQYAIFSASRSCAIRECNEMYECEMILKKWFISSCGFHSLFFYEYEYCPESEILQLCSLANIFKFSFYCTEALMCVVTSPAIMCEKCEYGGLKSFCLLIFKYFSNFLIF
jgi:hypothetical protein